jgi:hypothetical protein
MADDNRLWGAPRIHGELLMLGITVSERTVSRYLSHRWRPTVTDLAYIPDESPSAARCHLAGAITVRVRVW